MSTDILRLRPLYIFNPCGLRGRRGRDRNSALRPYSSHRIRLSEEHWPARAVDGRSIASRDRFSIFFALVGGRIERSSPKPSRSRSRLKSKSSAGCARSAEFCSGGGAIFFCGGARSEISPSPSGSSRLSLSSLPSPKISSRPPTASSRSFRNCPRSMEICPSFSSFTASKSALEIPSRSLESFSSRREEEASAVSSSSSKRISRSGS